MEQEPHPGNSQHLPVSWWFIWAATLLLSSVTAYLHHKWRVAEVIEPLRYPWGLLPAHWLIFRWFGELAGYLLIIVIIIGAIACLRPILGRKLIISSALLSLTFTVLYASYCGFLLVGFIKTQTEQIEASNEQPSSQDSKVPDHGTKPQTIPTE